MTQPATFGVLPTGFVIKTQQDVQNEIVAALLSTIANDLDLSPVEPLGQVVAITAEEDAEVWELAQVGYNATNRGAAEGAQLDNIGALTGTIRQPATYSQVFCAIALGAAGTYAAGSLVTFIAGLSSQFASNTTALVVPATNPLNGNPVTPTNPYVFGSGYAVAPVFQAPLTGADFGNALVAANAGKPSSGNIGSLTGQIPHAGWIGPTALSGTASVTHGSASVTFSGPQSLSRGQPITLDTTGAVYFLAADVLASTAATLTLPYGGTTAGAATATILGVADTTTPTIGGDVESDTAYRIRQVQDLGAQGSCNPAAIAVDVIDALQNAPSPVIASCTVYENVTDFTDANGLPPHSYQVVVFDGITPNTVQDDPIIGKQIWNNKPAGIQPYGTTSVTVLDSQGVSRTVAFSRPTDLTLYMIINAQIAPTANAAAVESLIETAIVAASQGKAFTAYGQTVVPISGSPTTLLPGVDVVPSAFGGVAQAQSGVVAVTSVLVGFAPSPTGTSKLPVSRSSIAVLLQANLTVNLTTFVP